MDTATRTISRRIATFLCLLVAASILGGQRPAPAREPLVIHGADTAQERAIDWSIRRYREAGLAGLPDLEVYLHRSHDACNGGIGLYHGGRIDLCTEDSSEPYQRKFALHEMAHAWTEANVDTAVLRTVHGHPRDRRLERPEPRLEGAGHRAGGRDHHLGARRGRRSHRSYPRPPTRRPSTGSTSC